MKLNQNELKIIKADEDADEIHIFKVESGYIRFVQESDVIEFTPKQLDMLKELLNE